MSQRGGRPGVATGHGKPLGCPSVLFVKDRAIQDFGKERADGSAEAEDVPQQHS